MMCKELYFTLLYFTYAHLGQTETQRQRGPYASAATAHVTKFRSPNALITARFTSYTSAIGWVAAQDSPHRKYRCWSKESLTGSS